MSLLHWEKATKKFSEHTLEERLYIVIGTIAFCLVTIFIMWAFYHGVNEFFLFDKSNFYIRESGAVISLISIVPLTSIMTIAGFQKIFNYKNEQMIKIMVKIMLYCVPLYLIIMTFSSFAIESNLKSKGYSYCYWYTGPSFREADVWLKNSDFCLQEGSVHISTVRGYFEKLKLEGLEPKLSELKQVLAVENEKRDKLLNR